MHKYIKISKLNFFMITILSLKKYYKNNWSSFFSISKVDDKSLYNDLPLRNDSKFYTCTPSFIPFISEI